MSAVRTPALRSPVRGGAATARASSPAQVTFTLAQARRIALAAQGFGTGRFPGAVTLRQVQRVVGAVGVLQIDSVNVLSRSHYLPVFSRLGPYPRALLDRACSSAPRRLVEYWAHEASFIPPATHRLLRFRMARVHDEAWGGMVRIAREQPALVAAVRDYVAQAGPVTAAQIERDLAPEACRDRSRWGWNWTDTKRAVSFLFWSGELSSAGRTAQFERRYDLPERVLPPEIAGAPDPSPRQAHHDLVEIAARAHGVATLRCLRDYFRLRPEPVKAAVAELVEEGVLRPVTVKGWNRPVYLHTEARIPRRISARALLSPFDSLIWERQRTEELFGFRYRIEIYTPAASRVHGYYVLPFLLGDRLAARVDLKADRSPGGGGVLRVQAAWREPEAEPGVAGELAEELLLMACWLGLDEVHVAGRGDLAADLAAALPAKSG
ncbi:MAG TPA: crosslink repair DNA glycosylase YcaQ family protein [Kineosporiaceae bacterium]|nr:crosslink repair DNA glycosylase YcaQ family protein [Kineosporiaceae bacterium]